MDKPICKLIKRSLRQKPNEYIALLALACFFIFSENRFSPKNWGATEYSIIIGTISYLFFRNTSNFFRKSSHLNPKKAISMKDVKEIISFFPVVKGKPLVKTLKDLSDKELSKILSEPEKAALDRWGESRLKRPNIFILYKIEPFQVQSLNWVDYVAFKVINKFSQELSINPVILISDDIFAPMDSEDLRWSKSDMENVIHKFVNNSTEMILMSELTDEIFIKSDIVIRKSLPAIKWLMNYKNFMWYTSRFKGKEHEQKAAVHVSRAMFWNSLITKKFLTKENAVFLLQWERTKFISLCLVEDGCYPLLYQDFKIAGKDGKSNGPGKQLIINPSKENIIGFNEIRNWIENIVVKSNTNKVGTIEDLEKFCLLLRCCKGNLGKQWDERIVEIKNCWPELIAYFKENKNLSKYLPKEFNPNPDKITKILGLIADEFALIDKKMES